MMNLKPCPSCSHVHPKYQRGRGAWRFESCNCGCQRRAGDWVLDSDIANGCECSLSARILRNLHDRLETSSANVVHSPDYRKEAGAMAREIEDADLGPIMCRCEIPNPQGVPFPSFRSRTP